MFGKNYDGDDHDDDAKQKHKAMVDAMFLQLQEQEKKRHEAAVKAIEFFIGKYVPADTETAEAFFTTSEIRNAVLIHTGNDLPATEVYETMSNMGYAFDARNGLEFYWLLRKE